MAESTDNLKASPQLADVGADEAKRTFGDLLARAGYGRERIPITRHGKRIAALVSAEDLEKLEAIAPRLEAVA